jgi:hypothetical protein
MCWHSHCWSRLAGPRAWPLLLCWWDSILDPLTELAPRVLELKGQLCSLLRLLAPMVWEEGLEQHNGGRTAAAEQQCQAAGRGSGLSMASTTSSVKDDITIHSRLAY